MAFQARIVFGTFEKRALERIPCASYRYFMVLAAEGPI